MTVADFISFPKRFPMNPATTVFAGRYVRLYRAKRLLPPALL